MEGSPLVTIQCLTYNHEKYIRKCLDGFVMQKTNFRFEAIVHDDASTDGTAKIVREYADKYPDIIKPIFETENQYSRSGGSLNRIMYEHTLGKYVALCEGDDYWTDPYKLQKQVDFLETHSDYSMCFHSAYIINDIKHIVTIKCSDINDREYSADEVFSSWIVPTASIVYNRVAENYQTKHNSWILNGDIVIILKCAQTGRLWGMSDKMSAYRIHDTGVTYDEHRKIQRQLAYPLHYEFIKENFPCVNKKIVNRAISEAYLMSFKVAKNVPDLIKSFKVSPATFFKVFIHFMAKLMHSVY